MFIYYLLLIVGVMLAVTRGILIKKTKRSESAFQTIRFNVMLFIVAFVALLPFALSNIGNFS